MFTIDLRIYLQEHQDLIYIFDDTVQLQSIQLLSDNQVLLLLNHVGMIQIGIYFEENNTP